MTDLTTAPRAIVDRSVAMAANALLLVTASFLAVPLAAALGLALRSRLEVQLDDLVNLSDPNYPKQIDLYVVVAWALLTAAIGLSLLKIKPLRSRAESTVDWVLARPGAVLAALALCAPIVPWLTGPAAGFPTVQFQASYTTALVVLMALAVAVVGIRRGLSAGEALTTLSVVSGALLGLLTLTLDLLPRPAFLVTATLFAAAALVAGLIATTTRQRASRTVLVGQCFLPLLLVVLLAPPGAATTTGLMLLVAAVIVALVVAAVRHTRRSWSTDSPLAALHAGTPALLTAYLVGLGRLPQGGVPTDEYHWGEMLLQWPAVAEFGQRPYVDFIPAPGLNGVVYGFVNSLLADNAITFQRALQVVLAVCAGALAITVCRLVGKGWALMLVPAMAAVVGGVLADRFTLVALSAAVLMLPGLWRRPGAWLGVWSILAALGLLFIPGSGTAFIVASVIAVLVQAAGYVRGWRSWKLVDHVVLVTGMVSVVLLLPLVIDVLRYVAAQGSGNDVAWGLPVLPHLTGLEPVFVAALDVLRMSGWWLGLPLCVALLLVRGRDVSGLRLIAASILVFAVALTPYTFGRIEKSGLSRVGLASLLILGLLVPLALGGVRARVTGRFGAFTFKALALSTAVLAGMPALVLGPGLGGLRAMVVPTVVGQELGLPYAGTGPAVQAESLRARTGLLQELAGDQPFLDLANGTAFYYFSGVPAPIPTAALWNNASQAEQDAAVEALRQNPPGVVFVNAIDPTNPPWWDPQLRAYRMTRWLFENGYRAYDIAGMTVLLSPEAAARAASLTPLDPATADARLISSYPRLAEQYRAWGRNWQRLQDRFDVVPTTVTTGEPVTVRWEPGGARPDFLLMDVTCPGGATAAFNWGSGVVPIPVVSGPLLVPLGAYPSWHDATGSELRISLPAGCAVGGQPQMARLIQ